MRAWCESWRCRLLARDSDRIIGPNRSYKSQGEPLLLNPQPLPCLSMPWWAVVWDQAVVQICDVDIGSSARATVSYGHTEQQVSRSLLSLMTQDNAKVRNEVYGLCYCDHAQHNTIGELHGLRTHLQLLSLPAGYPSRGGFLVQRRLA